MSSVSIPIAETESLLWTIIRRLELLAGRQYEQFAPQLLTESKRQFVDSLMAFSSDGPMDAHPGLNESVTALEQAAARANEAQTLVVQGLILEHLGLTMYRLLARGKALSEGGAALAQSGVAAAESTIEAARARAIEAIGEGTPLFNEIQAASRDVLATLDALGNEIDDVFGNRFGLSFEDLVGDFTSDLTPFLVQMGVNRRELMCFLTSSFMGM